MDTPEPELAPEIEKAKSAARALNLSDALSETAHKQKRNLLAWSAIAFLVHYYRITLTEIPVIHAEIPEGATGAALVIVAVPLIYSFLGFLIYAVSDLWAWHFHYELGRFSPLWDTLYRLNENVWTVRAHVDDKTRPPHIVPQQAAAIIEAVTPQLRQSVDALKAVQDIGSTATAWKKFIAYGWEFTVPLAFGALALWMAVPPFARELITLLSSQ